MLTWPYMLSLQHIRLCQHGNRFACSLVSVLATSKVRTGTNMWQCPLMVTLQCCSTWKSYHWHHDLTPHSVTLSCPGLTSRCSILLMPGSRLGSDKYQFYKSLVWLDWKPISCTEGPCSTDFATVSMRLVGSWCQRPGLPVGQHYNVTISAQCHKYKFWYDLRYC